jgi:hypothetical protein
MKKVALLTGLLFALSTFAAAQMNMSQEKKPLSPPANTECKFSDGKTIKVDYSSPRAKGRKIFGPASENALVPYGEVWRTGANNATTFVTDVAVKVGDKEVPAGSYTIFTVPNADKWTLIINKKTGEWGIPYKYEADELGRVPMSVSKTSGPVENFTVGFDQAGKKCTLRMEWENTRASVDVTEK